MTQTHPVTLRLVTDILHNRNATSTQRQQLVNMLSTADFNRALQDVRQETHQACPFPLPDKLPSDQLHLIKRIHQDQEWDASTSLADYFADIHAMFAHPDLKLVVYGDPPNAYVGCFAPSTIPIRRRGSSHSPTMFAAYSVRHDVFISAHLTKRPQDVKTGRNPVWL